MRKLLAVLISLASIVISGVGLMLILGVEPLRLKRIGVAVTVFAVAVGLYLVDCLISEKL